MKPNIMFMCDTQKTSTGETLRNFLYKINYELCLKNIIIKEQFLQHTKSFEVT